MRKTVSGFRSFSLGWLPRVTRRAWVRRTCRSLLQGCICEPSISLIFFPQIMGEQLKIGKFAMRSPKV